MSFNYRGKTTLVGESKVSRFQGWRASRLEGSKAQADTSVLEILKLET
jgi:hypothetical protein